MSRRLTYVVVLLFFFGTVVLAGKTFRFALFTDLHISTLQSQATEDLQNAIKEVNGMQGVDFVLVTGDIADKGDSASLVTARNLLKTLKIPFYIIPGNHDFQWKEKSGSRTFVQVFGDDRFLFTHNNYLFAGIPTVPLKKNSNVASIQQNDFQWLKKSLNKNGKKKSFILVTHYPLLEGDVENPKEVNKQLQKLKIKLVLSGHYHRNMLVNYDGIPGIVNRSTLRGKTNTGGYSVYTLNDSLKVSEKRIGEPEEEWVKLRLIKNY